MTGCCGQDQDFSQSTAAFRRRLWWVIGINAGMFAVELTAGRLGHSGSLQADALDFFADASTYAISLAVLGASLKIRASAAFVKGLSLLGLGAWVMVSGILQIFDDTLPAAEVMGGIGFLALAANLLSVFLLVSFKDGDANIRSVWLCSRNDAIGNVAVMLAGLAVWVSASKWPDIIVALGMASLFTWSATQILQQAWKELSHPGQVTQPPAKGMI